MKSSVSRCLLLPRVWEPRNPETVSSRVPTESQNVYFEITLTPEEAEAYALDLLVDARRAKAARASREWMEKLSRPPP